LKTILLALALLWPGALAAQNLSFDIGGTLACLRIAQDDRAKQDCIGVSAGACINAPSGSTTVGMGGCLSLELDYWDAQLNVAYRDLRARERANDAQMGGPASRADALRAMQRAWIKFRDTTCEYERSQFGGGSAGGPVAVDCLLRMTGLQTLYLQRMNVVY